MKKIKIILSNIIITVLLIIAIILIYYFVQTNILGKDYANILGFTFFKVETGSMKKEIQIDDFVIIKINDQNIKQNDIITYKDGQNYITHRVVLINEQEIITKGDNNNTEDSPIKKEQILGKVVLIIKNVAVWKKVFLDIKVIISSLITIILFIILVAYKEVENKGQKEKI